MKEIKKFLLCLIFRFLCFLFTDTWFVPDEYFQCTEVAYSLVFNRAHLTWEWTRDTPLRSYLHPLMVSWLYKVYKYIGGDTNLIIRIIPNLLHSYFFALGDVFYCLLCERIFFANPRGYTITLLLYFTNWFLIYCSSRPLANCLECVLIIVALYWYPLYDDEVAPKTHVTWKRRRSYLPYMVLGSLSIIIRPTAAIIWSMLGIYHLLRTRYWLSVLKNAVFGSLTPLAFAIAVDSNFELPVKVPLWEFAKFNFLSGGSAHFGVHPWYWYLIDGLLVTTGGMYLPALLAYMKQCEKQLNRTPPTILFGAALVYVFVHSWLPHKEHRFMLPVIPLILPFAGLFMSNLYRLHPRFVRWFLVLFTIANLSTAWFFCRVHQRGVLDATKDLIEDVDVSRQRLKGQTYHITQLTPCYSMPQYAYFHQLPVRHHMLDCSPNLSKLANYVDESDLFHQNPVDFFANSVNYRRFLNHKNAYVVIYRKTFMLLKELLYDSGYRVWRRYNHTIIPTDDNQDTILLVLKRSSNA